MRQIDKIIIHCTATPKGREVSVSEIRKWHLARGFSDIGYHFIIHLDGVVSRGRDVMIAGAHCKGHNSHSIGISYVGGMDINCKNLEDTRTEAQKHALKMLIEKYQNDIPDITIHGHNEFSSKACPSFDVKQWLIDEKL